MDSPHRKLLDLADLLRPSAIRAAATLGIADHVAAGVTDVADLAVRTGTRPDMLAVLLRYLVELGLLENETGGYRLTELGSALRSDDPGGVRNFLSSEGLYGSHDLSLVHLVHTLRTGEPTFTASSGRTYWESVNDDPRYSAAFDAQGDSPPAWDMDLVVDGYDWSGVRTVVDVGGHDGTLLLELLRRHPHLHGTLVDLRNVAERAGRRFAAAGLDDRGTALVGSFFETLPAGHDVYLLSAILADWTDEQAVAILRRCGEAAGPTGVVRLAEVTVPTESAAKELYVHAMMPAHGRGVDELTKLADAAGLDTTWVGPTTPLRSLLEFAPRSAS